MALTLRLIGGFFDSITSVTRASIADITHPSTRGPVFTWLGAVFALARVVSSGLGGLLSGIRFFGSDYLLACLVGSSMSVAMFFSTIFFIPETLPDKGNPCGTVCFSFVCCVLLLLIRDHL
jgi:MFS family permease